MYTATVIYNNISAHNSAVTRSARRIQLGEPRGDIHTVSHTHANVHAVASSHCLADTVKGGELSYTILAIKREGIVYSSLLQLTGTVLAEPEPMLSRLVRGCIRSPWPSLLAYSLLHAATALLMIPSRAASSVI